MTYRYAWLITKDIVCDGADTGARGPRGDKTPPVTIIKEGEKFLMYDDDGNLNYEGYLHDPDEDASLFEPLDDFGRPNAGCTGIKYRDSKTKEWEWL